jgi:hypothetical protein
MDHRTQASLKRGLVNRRGEAPIERYQPSRNGPTMSLEAQGIAASSSHTQHIAAPSSWRTDQPMDVTLRLSDPGELDALRAFLEKRECRVQLLAPDLLYVGLPHELHDQQARMEVDLYLRVWESLHDTRVEIVPEH